MSKFLLAISGGPDSMFLLWKYRQKSVVVAHVNYHKRIDSDHDQKIVEEFCQQHKIPYHVKNITEEITGNFQNEARKIRYEFFKEIYDQYGCKYLLTAHHNDDFLETAWMQMTSKRVPRFYGIRSKQELNGMKIRRPLIGNYWKDEIVILLEKKQIPYAIDSTNQLPIYERNKIRLELSQISPAERQRRYEWFLLSNQILKKKFRRVDRQGQKWAKNSYQLAFFRNLTTDQPEILFEQIHQHFGDVSLSSGKLIAIIDFINGPEGKKDFIIEGNHKVRKEKGQLHWK